MWRWGTHGDVDGDDADRQRGAPVVTDVVAGGRAFDVAVVVAQPPRRQKGGQHGVADRPELAVGGVVAGGIDALRGDELVAGGVQGGGEAGPVWVEAGAGFDRIDHCGAQQLVERQQMGSPILIGQRGPARLHEGGP
jgi:hypothetical protein